MEELLMCSVCIERYHEKERHPVLLPRCGHSFCRPCIKMLLAGGGIVCPTCRSDQRIESVERLPTEYTLLAIIRAQEESRKEICEKHRVKLSFWCRTCSTPACGECLFEDHPTHSHTVTKATDYIGEMKQNAYDIAVKFMEVLDDREQSFYKTIFNSAKKISNALRNIGALRKDMEEARELMKGIKEDDSIGSATSLSEAAKFLGLKWNIQDANIYQPAQSTEDDKPKTGNGKTDKEQIMEEEMEAEREKEKLKQKATKEEKKAAKKLSSAASVEEPKVESVSLPVKQDVKNAETSVTIPLQEEIKKEVDQIKEQIASSVAKDDAEEKEMPLEEKNEPKDCNNLVAETQEAEELNKSIKEKPKKEQIEDLSKFREELTKLKHGLKKTEEHTESPSGSKTATASNSEPKSKGNHRKEKSLASSKLNYLARSAAAKAAAESAPNSPGATSPPADPPSVQSPSTPTTSDEESKALEESSPSASSTNSSPKEDAQENAESNREIKELEETTALIESESVKDTESINPDSGLSEDSKAAAVKKEIKCELKLQDCIQVPGFMIAVESEDGRLGELEWGPQGLHVHCMQFHSVQYDIVVKANILNTMVSSMHPIAFLELSVEQNVLGRVYIRLWGHLRRSHNFITLCLGDRGKSYLNTKFLQVYNVGMSGERMLGGDYESNNGRGGHGIIDDLEWNSEYAMPMKAGMITAAGTGQSNTNSLFLLCSQSDPDRNFSCPFGLVCEGLKVVKEAVQCAITKDVFISDCGVLLVPPRSDAAKYFG